MNDQALKDLGKLYAHQATGFLLEKLGGHASPRDIEAFYASATSWMMANAFMTMLMKAGPVAAERFLRQSLGNVSSNIRLLKAPFMAGFSLALEAVEGETMPAPTDPQPEEPPAAVDPAPAEPSPGPQASPAAAGAPTALPAATGAPTVAPAAAGIPTAASAALPEATTPAAAPEPAEAPADTSALPACGCKLVQGECPICPMGLKSDYLNLGTFVVSYLKTMVQKTQNLTQGCMACGAKYIDQVLADMVRDWIPQDASLPEEIQIREQAVGIVIQTAAMFGIQEIPATQRAIDERQKT